MKKPPDETRAAWRWCPGCQALREGWHQHGDPIEELSRDELLAMVRVLRLGQAQATSEPRTNGVHR